MCDCCKEEKLESDVYTIKNDVVCLTCYPEYKKQKQRGYHNEYMKNYRKNRCEEKIEKDRLYMREYMRGYRKTDTYKETARRYNLKRLQEYGYKSINKWFEGAEYHHLHYDQYGNVDKSIGMYIPKELHQSIRHNGNTGKGIKEMADTAWNWYFGICAEKLKANGTYETVDAWL